jgi:hypothetical protein
MKTPYQTIDEILDLVDIKSEILEIDFSSNIWHQGIPGKPGWYEIRTITTIDELALAGDPLMNSKHYNFPIRIKAHSTNPFPGVLIRQEPGKKWVVYNGHAKNLMARAREHHRGNKGTGCLGLDHYKALHGGKWEVRYCLFDWLECGMDDHQYLRKLIEQAWRGRHGWPVLCKA